MRGEADDERSDDADPYLSSDKQFKRRDAA